MGSRGILWYVTLVKPLSKVHEQHADQLIRKCSHFIALTATPEGNRVFKRLGFASRYVEAKADGDEAEMLVREGNDTFISS